MRYKAQIKTITKVDKPPFADGIYTWEIETTKHKGLYYTSKLNIICILKRSPLTSWSYKTAYVTPLYKS